MGPVSEMSMLLQSASNRVLSRSLLRAFATIFWTFEAASSEEEVNFQFSKNAAKENVNFALPFIILPLLVTILLSLEVM